MTTLGLALSALAAVTLIAVITFAQLAGVPRRTLLLDVPIAVFWCAVTALWPVYVLAGGAVLVAIALAVEAWSP